MSKKLFDFCIGNPPYQESRATTKDIPVYNDFMDVAYNVASDVLLITPARFLFNAGATPKAWNEKMLNDPHFKVVDYIPNSNAIFANTDIKGGVAITYRSDRNKYEPIGEFISNPMLRDIVGKVKKHGYDSLSNYIYGGRADLKYNDLFLETYPNYVSDRIKQIQKKKPSVTSLPPNEEYELRNRAFEDAPYAFKEEIEKENETEYYRILGLFGMKRVYRWLEKKYLTMRYPDNNNVQHYKVFISKASGTGAFGEKISEPIIGVPNEFSTPTFIGIGRFEKEIEAKNASNYIKTKFARALLSVLKITQDIVPGKFKYVPVQDFSDDSDIDWSKSIHDIDLQLYRKYGLSAEEVAFIEKNVKEME